jgi:hypothetical protein
MDWCWEGSHFPPEIVGCVVSCLLGSRSSSASDDDESSAAPPPSPSSFPGDGPAEDGAPVCDDGRRSGLAAATDDRPTIWKDRWRLPRDIAGEIVGPPTTTSPTIVPLPTRRRRDRRASSTAGVTTRHGPDAHPAPSSSSFVFVDFFFFVAASTTRKPTKTSRQASNSGSMARRDRRTRARTVTQSSDIWTVASVFCHALFVL